MAVIYNNTTVENILYNGGGVKSLNVNGVEVYKKVAPYEEFLNETTISQSDFLTKVCISETFSDINPSTNLPYAKDFIGKIITNINSSNDTYMHSTDWKIADYNHDGSSNTFDLISETTIRENVKFNSASYNQNYEYSTARSNVLYMINMFDLSLRNKLKTMSVTYDKNSNLNNATPSGHLQTNYNDTSADNPVVLQDKSKILSLTELGYDNVGYSVAKSEGSRYPIYTEKTQATTYADVKRKIYNSTNYGRYWTRSRYLLAYDFCVVISDTGGVAMGNGGVSDAMSQNGIVACIRVGV